MDPHAFILAAGRGEEDAVRAALAADAGLAASRDAAGISVITLTAYAGRAHLAREMAALRSDLDLFEAACLGDLERVRSLLDRRPEAIDRHSPDGFTALGLAARFGHVPLLDHLIARGADFDTPSVNAQQIRPLHSAASQSDPSVAFAGARRLLVAGADPNARRQGGFTPLHDGVRLGHVEVVRLLLQHGANPHLSNDEGDSPLQLAHTSHHDTLSRMLDETMRDLH